MPGWHNTGSFMLVEFYPCADKHMSCQSPIRIWLVNYLHSHSHAWPLKEGVKHHDLQNCPSCPAIRFGAKTVRSHLKMLQAIPGVIECHGHPSVGQTANPARSPHRANACSGRSCVLHGESRKGLAPPRHTTKQTTPTINPKYRPSAILEDKAPEGLVWELDNATIAN